MASSAYAFVFSPLSDHKPEVHSMACSAIDMTTPKSVQAKSTQWITEMKEIKTSPLKLPETPKPVMVDGNTSPLTPKSEKPVAMEIGTSMAFDIGIQVTPRAEFASEIERVPVERIPSPRKKSVREFATQTVQEIST